MQDNPVRWFEIYVQDMSRARSFYEGVLGVTLEQLGGPGIEMWGFPMGSDKPGTGGALVRAPGVPSGGNSTLVYFATEDCAREESRVAHYGGTVHRPKMSIGQYGFVNLVGFHSMQ
jgi:predicted enzyme related to lactoylglutathione lyase